MDKNQFCIIEKCESNTYPIEQTTDILNKVTFLKGIDIELATVLGIPISTLNKMVNKTKLKSEKYFRMWISKQKSI